MRSTLDRMQRDPGFFFWATGIEDTFITSPWPKTGRTLDEYELTGHYDRWREDLDRMGELGVTLARYGIPWHRVNPARGRWDWDFADRTLEHLLALGIDPIVDLVHYGTPPWIEGAYLHPDFPQLMAEYARRVAERFRGRIHLYTPLNEPRITAWYCGRLGWWPPNLRGWKGFLRVILPVCRGIVETFEALREVDPQIVPAPVDATDLYESDDPDLAGEVERRQALVFLSLDLITGRMDEHHPLTPWLRRQGLDDKELAWFREHAVDLPWIGINLYPLFSRKVLVRTRTGVRIRMPYADADIVERLASLYYARYQRPVFIAETASCGSIPRRRRWLEDSVRSVARARSRGIPLVGYTWWPMFALVTWACRQGTQPPACYLRQMGLWDLDSDPAGGMRRIRTPLVDAYRELVSGGAAAVGRVEKPLEMAHVS